MSKTFCFVSQTRACENHLSAGWFVLRYQDNAGSDVGGISCRRVCLNINLRIPHRKVSACKYANISGKEQLLNSSAIPCFYKHYMKVRTRSQESFFRNTSGFNTVKASTYEQFKIFHSLCIQS